MSSYYSSAAWRVGKTGPPPIFASIGVRSQRLIELDAELRSTDSLESLFALVEREIDRFDAGNIVITVAQIPKVHGDNFQAFAQSKAWLELQSRMRRALGRLEPRGLSMIAYALARLRLTLTSCTWGFH